MIDEDGRAKLKLFGEGLAFVEIILAARKFFDSWDLGTPEGGWDAWEGHDEDEACEATPALTTALLERTIAEPQPAVELEEGDETSRKSR